MPINQGPSLRVCIYPEGDYLIAQCVDYDIAAHGPDEESAIQEFIRAYMAHVLVAIELGQPPLEELPPAPPHVADDWKKLVVRGGGKVTAFQIPAFAVVKEGEELPTHFFQRLEAVNTTDAAA